MRAADVLAGVVVLVNNAGGWSAGGAQYPAGRMRTTQNPSAAAREPGNWLW